MNYKNTILIGNIFMRLLSLTPLWIGVESMWNNAFAVK